jgi:Neprosin
MADLVTFNEFLDRLDDSKIDHHVETLTAGLMRFASLTAKGAAKAKPADGEEEFAKMKKYLLEHYRGTSAAHTFQDPNGNFIDCIPIEEQPTYRAAKEAGIAVKLSPPPPPILEPATPGRKSQSSFGPLGSPILPPLRRGLTDFHGRAVACPEGHVPIRRTTLAQLAQFGKLENFFLKNPNSAIAAPASATKAMKAKSGKAGAKKATKRTSKPAPLVFGGSGEAHRHVVYNAEGTTFNGSSSWLNVWNVEPAPSVFNLSQQWLIAPAWQNNAGQTIESGWQKWPTKQGSNYPVLFLFYNPDNYGPRSGYFSNQNNQGFIRLSSDWPLGTSIEQVSTHGGPQYGFQMVWVRADNGDWWLYLGSDESSIVAVGYFPQFLYQGGLLGSGGAHNLQFGGEVCSLSQSQQATGPMGSGTRPFSDPTAGFGDIAFQKVIKIQAQSGGDWVDATLDRQNTGDQQFYDGTLGSSTAWGTYFFFGGGHAP